MLIIQGWISRVRSMGNKSPHICYNKGSTHPWYVCTLCAAFCKCNTYSCVASSVRWWLRAIALCMWPLNVMAFSHAAKSYTEYDCKPSIVWHEPLQHVLLFLANNIVLNKLSYVESSSWTAVVVGKQGALCIWKAIIIALKRRQVCTLVSDSSPACWG